MERSRDEREDESLGGPMSGATEGREPAGSAPPGGRSRTADARLARLHLRACLISLARAELETMAAQNALDTIALADLAEARWRSGDLLGAGRAAQAHLEAGGDEVMALVVMAEALGAQGRTGEALELAARVIAKVGSDLEPIFAGQSRGPAWPRVEPPRDRTVAAAMPQARRGENATRGPIAAAAAPAHVGAPVRGSNGAAAAGAGQSAPVAGGAAEELAAVESLLEAGRTEAIAGRLALLLRAHPELASQALRLADAAIERVGGRGPVAANLHLVRGDAYRMLERDEDASKAFVESRRALRDPGVAKEEA